MSQPQIQIDSPEIEQELGEPDNLKQETAEQPLKAEEAVEVPTEDQEQDFDPRQRVEFSTPEQQKKFNDVYKQMRMSDARNKMQEAMLAKAMEKISEFESRFSQTDSAEAERILTSRLKEARDSGDEDKADAIFKEIVKFNVAKEIASVKQTEKPVAINSADDADVQTVVQLAGETDNSGVPLRPWIAQGHPQHNEAMKLAGALALQVNAELGYTDIGEVFRRMDNAMKTKNSAPKIPLGNSRAADPMRGNLTNRPAQGKMKLSPAELNAAQKLGVKPEDYLKWKR